MQNHYLFRVGDAKHFISSSGKCIWGINSKHTSSMGFMNKVKEGDKLWFIKSKTNGQIIAVATFTSIKPRILGPLIPLSYTNNDLGWTETDGEWDTEIHYTNLYNLTECDLISEIKSPCVIRLYNDKCKVNLPTEYDNIVRYSKVTTSMNLLKD